MFLIIRNRYHLVITGYLFRYGKKSILYITIMPLVGYLYMSYLCKSNILEDIFKPLLVAQNSTISNMIGQGDFMSFITRLTQSYTHPNSLSIALIALFCSILTPIIINKKYLSELAFWSIISISSLCFVRHLYYDYVFLIFPLYYIIVNKISLYNIFIAFSISWFWFLSLPIRKILTFYNLIDVNYGYDVTALFIGFGFLLNILSIVSLLKNESNKLKLNT